MRSVCVDRLTVLAQPPVAASVLLAALLYGLDGDTARNPVDVEQSYYVLYHGLRLPLSTAGRFACHDLARPEIRCFDTVEELRADIAVHFPGQLWRFDRLMSEGDDR